MQAILFAEQEMRRTGHPAISPGHLLLGLVVHGDNPAASIVCNAGVTLDALRSIVDTSLGAAASELPKDIRLNDDAKAVVKLAEEIASYSDVFYVRPEHVFAAMLRQKDGLEVQCLRRAGIDDADAEAIALRVIDDLHEEHSEELLSSKAPDRERFGSRRGFDQAKAASRAEKARLAVHEAAQRRGSRKSSSWQKWHVAADEFHRAIDAAYPPGFWENYTRLKEGQPEALEIAMVFLEDDPWFFRSGYIKVELIKYIGRTTLTEDRAQRLRRIALHAVDSRDRREFRAYCRLARKIDSSDLRNALLRRTNSFDDGIRRRARWMLEALGTKPQEAR